ncbi:lysosomal alpha-mannosidase-like [Planoprotostelium fungivorum]|uniref:alpha-mannosidase n=1 Tax=Planoprotostelium fungivorum TaxID=1890364 RepID=A0A2P6MNE1_9EUKA|nr:lysosomal alpha-mannosidase-like [Planoprotostelium fungivorum]
MKTLVLLFLLLNVVAAAGLNEKVDVYVVTHSHDDVGWLKTVQGYYDESVRSIITTVVEALNANPARRFSQVEVTYLRMWWAEATSAQKDQMKKLVDNKQLEFNVGGMTMNDEALTTYYEEINQMTDGSHWLWKTFGVRPASVWHIDPFGHSTATASLWSQMGFDSWGLNRIPYWIKDQMKAEKGLEFVWQGSPSLGSASNIWAHVMDSHYSTPTQINFDGNWDLKKVADDTVENPWEPYVMTLEQVTELRTRSTWYPHNKLMIPYGDDFKHVHAVEDYDNMDKLIDYINSNPTYNMTLRYAFVSDYVRDVNRLNLTWSTFRGDFFPLADVFDRFWTGFYTSRPAFKQYVRKSDAALATAEVTLAMGSLTGAVKNVTSSEDEIQKLREATSIATHHDSIPGTETVWVQDDYNLRLREGNDAAADVVRDITREWMGVGDNEEVREYHVITNPLAWDRKEIVSVLTNRTGAVVRYGETVVPSQVNPVPVYSKAKATHRLYFSVNIPPLSSATYNIAYNNDPATFASTSNTLTNGIVQLDFNEISGKLTKIADHRRGRQVNATMDLLQYVASYDSPYSTESNAWVFSPQTDSVKSYPGGQDIAQVNMTIYPRENVPYVFATAYKNDDEPIIVTPGYASVDQVSCSISRADFGGKLSGNGQVDFIVWNDFPLKDLLPQVEFDMGRTSLKTPGSIKVAYNFSVAPVVILSASTTSQTKNILLTATLQSANTDSFTATVHRMDGEDSWNEDDQVVLQWLAVTSGGYRASGQHFYAAGTSKAPAGQKQTLTKIDVEYSENFALDPVVMVTPVCASGAAFNLNVRNKSVGGFSANLFRYNETSEMSLNYISIPRYASVERVARETKNVVYSGKLVKELQQYYAPNYGQTYVQYVSNTFQAHITEVISEVGPIPGSRELVARLDTSIATDTTMYTDDNGLEVVQRKFRENVSQLQAGNYFPMVQRAFVRDEREDVDLQLDILSDSSHGIGSLSDGQVEIMLHRRHVREFFGNPMDDQDAITPSLWLSIGDTSSQTFVMRYVSLLQQFPLSIQKVEDNTRERLHIPNGMVALPSNVHLLTLRVFGGSYLLRLQHIFAADEHQVYSKPVKVHLKRVVGDLFKNATITEYNLSANQPVDEMTPLKWNTKEGDEGHPYQRVPLREDGVLILQPMEIRTFLMDLTPCFRSPFVLNALKLYTTSGHRQIIIMSRKKDTRFSVNFGALDRGSLAPTSSKEAVLMVPSQNTWLARAIEKNREDEVAAIIKTYNAGAVQATDHLGRNCIHVCAQYGTLTMLELLLKHEPDWRAGDNFGVTPLHLASQSARYDIVDRLISLGADVKLMDDGGNTSLHYLCGSTIPKEKKTGFLKSFNDMIKAGADLYARNITGDVPLHEACRTGSITAVKVMAEQRGIELDSSNLQKETPLHHAARRGEKRIVRILLEKDVNFGAESESGTAAQVARENNHHEVVSLIMNYAEKKKKQVAKATMNRKTRMTEEDVFKQLEYNAEKSNRFEEFKRLVSESKIDQQKLMNLTSPTGRTLMMVANYHGNWDLVTWLLSKGFPVNGQDKNGWTNLHYAACSDNGKVVIGLLKQRDINVNIKNHDQNTPLHYLAKNTFFPNLMPEIMEILHTKFMHFNATNVNGETALHNSCWKGNMVVTRLLIEKGININLPNKMGETALHWAVRAGQENHVTLLIDRGADITIKGQEGLPLDIATSALQPKDSIILALGGKPKNKEEEESNKRSWFQNMLKKHKEQQASDVAGDVKFEMQTKLNWLIKHDELQVHELLGTGRFGAVYRGTYRGQTVAVKHLQNVNGKYELQKEFDIMSAMRFLITFMTRTYIFRSPRVVYFYGVVLSETMTAYIIMSYCAKGALTSVLRDTLMDLNWPLVFKWCRQIVQIIHRDLKSLNLLVDEYDDIVVSDFGISRFVVDDNLSTLGKLRGTYAYCAPEIYLGAPATVKSDIFSLGVIFWELATRCVRGEYVRPYSEFRHLIIDFQIIIQVAKDKLRPTIPQGCPEMFANLIRICWDATEDCRPSCKEILEHLNKFARDYEAKPEDWKRFQPSDKNTTFDSLFAALDGAADDDDDDDIEYYIRTESPLSSPRLDRSTSPTPEIPSNFVPMDPQRFPPKLTEKKSELKLNIARPVRSVSSGEGDPPFVRALAESSESILPEKRSRFNLKAGIDSLPIQSAPQSPVAAVRNNRSSEDVGEGHGPTMFRSASNSPKSSATLREVRRSVEPPTIEPGSPDSAECSSPSLTPRGTRLLGKSRAKSKSSSKTMRNPDEMSWFDYMQTAEFQAMQGKRQSEGSKNS